MKRILFSLLAIIILSCNNDQAITYALISGKVENSTAEKVEIKNGDFEKAISIKPDGTFTDTLKLSESGFFTLTINRERTSIYLKNGDDIYLNVNTNQFDETISYKGNGSNENNYLATKQLNEEKLTSDPNRLFSLDEETFKAKIDSLKQIHFSLLTKIENVNPDFLKYETQNLEYDSYALLNRYERNHKYYTKLDDFEITDDFLPEGLKNLTYDDTTAYKMSSSYKNIVFGKTINDLFETIGNDYLYTSPEDLKVIENLAIPTLKDDIVDYLGSFLVSPGNPNMVSVYEFFLANTTNDKVKTKLHEVFENGKDLITGNPSPQFTNYENHKGGTMSLSDLKGKYVYIDVWATWCGPCKREIPSLKEVEKQFHGKNIEFVSTSIDVAKDYDKWVAMVNDMNLGGIQLFADNDWNSKFITDYGIKGIPRFILVDPEGNIVSADAPRPSNPKLVELLNSLDNI